MEFLLEFIQEYEEQSCKPRHWIDATNEISSNHGLRKMQRERLKHNDLSMWKKHVISFKNQIW
jgi:hypothetical protein